MKKVEIISEYFKNGSYSGEKRCLIDLNTKKRLSPNVDAILYDENGDFFILIDSIDGDLTKLYFYMDKEGNVLGTGFTSMDNQMYWVEVSNENDTYPFETYDKFKTNLKKKFIANFDQNIHDNLNNSLKMLEYDKRQRKTL